MDPFQASIAGTREIGLAVLATTLSLMAVFVPIGFMSGIVGRFMSSFGLTAAFAVGISMLVSFSLTPMLSARLIKVKKKEKTKTAEINTELEGEPPKDEPEGDSKHRGFYRYVDGAYHFLLKFSMGHRWLIVALCGLVLLSIIPLFMMVGKNFLPVDD